MSSIRPHNAFVDAEILWMGSAVPQDAFAIDVAVQELAGTKRAYDLGNTGGTNSGVRRRETNRRTAEAATAAAESRETQ